MLMRITATLATLLLATACTAQAPPAAGEYQQGTHYYLIEPPQQQASEDTIEVVEVFSYTCIHCSDAQPFVSKWKQALPEDVSFSYLPVAFGGAAEAFARAYYTAETMGVLDKVHEPLFKAFHVERRPFRNLEDIAGFFGDQGVDKDQALATMNSFAVNAKIARAQQLVPRYQIEGTPSMIVAGKYRVVSRGGFDTMLDVVDWLVERERAARQQQGG